jgi:hypothetical protein
MRFIAAVCHQPPERYLAQLPRSLVLRAALRRALVLIALGPSQAEALKAINANVQLVPHGVDTEWFSPNPLRSPQTKYLAVGGWLRDRKQTELVSLARLTGGLVQEVGPGRPRLSDKEYRDALQEANAVLLWISNGVASNAVVEAASAGKPVIGRLSSDLCFYLAESNRALLALPVKNQFEVPPDELASLGRDNRKHTLANYSWPNVARQLLAAATEPLTHGTLASG